MKRLLFALTLLLLLTSSMGVALAAPLNNVIIRAGEEINRDLVVPGGNLDIEEGAIVNGSVTVFGGNADIGGQVNGDVALFGGKLTLSGDVQGDVTLFGGNLDLAETAVVSGDCVTMGGSVSGDGVTCASFGGFPAFPTMTMFDSPRSPSPGWSVARMFQQASELFSRSLLLSIVALIIAAAFPVQLERVVDTVVARPAASGAVGVLTGIAVPSLALLLLLISVLLIIVCIGLLGFPVVMLMMLALAAAGVMGWTAIGYLFGRKLFELFKMAPQSLMMTAVLGTALLTLSLGFLGFLPLGGFFSWLLTWGLMSVGLGAVALTQFGRHSYPHFPPSPGPRRKSANFDEPDDEVEDIPLHKM